jgi:hypothetical protein
MPDKEQSPTVTEPRIEAGEAMAHERTCYAVTRADLLWIYAAMSAAYPTPDLGKDEELEKALFYKRQWHQESARAERLDNENRAQAARLEALHAEREKLAYHAEQIATYIAQPAVSEKHLASARWHNDQIRAAALRGDREQGEG